MSAQTSLFADSTEDCGSGTGTKWAMTFPRLVISKVSLSSSTIRKTSSICSINSLASNIFIAAFYMRIRSSLISHSTLALTDFSILHCFIANREKILESFFGRLRCAHFYVQLSQYLRVFNTLHLLLCIEKNLWKTCLNDIKHGLMPCSEFTFLHDLLICPGFA